MTLQHLIDTRAGSWKRRQYAEQTPLGELRRELSAYLTATDKARYDTDPDTAWGFEGLTAAYAWTRNRGPDLFLGDDSKIGDHRYRWIAIYPVEGSSEGHYIHVDLIHGEANERRTTLFLTKTFAGQDAAINLAGELCRLLGV